ncbi:MAG TPA: polyhydroxyalkanoate synthesis regulator DNA-binding domain-containing protein [Gemmatimonadaceae bacterium]|nr:polyhydroxyalkanoate synthesis regulator DNA-binding domain-containing protein [Gemmatimonadaceae bacterium]
MTTRLITRYGSRKLYDTGARRYVSLDDLARHVRAGEHLRVLDKATGHDVTAQTLALVVYEQARQGEPLVTSELLHDVIRSGVGQLQERVDALVQSAGEHLPPLARAREEMQRLRAGMREVERTLRDLAGRGGKAPPRPPRRGKPKRKAGRRR